MKIEIGDSNIDVQGHLDQVRSEALWKYAAAQWHKLYYPYVPRRKGILADTVEIRAGEIEHTVPYAHRQYTGHFKFRKDHHPLASREWDKAAMPTQFPHLVSAIQGYIDRMVK